MHRYTLRHEPFGTLVYDSYRDEIYINKELSEFPSKNLRQVKTEYRDAPISFPTTVFLEVTKRCNSNCNHCFNNSGDVLQKELTFKQWCYIIDDLYENGIFTVKVTGGEPFCRDDIYDILDYLEERNINFIIFTNGKEINQESLEKLSKYQHLLCVRVSLDGNKETNDEIRGKGAYVAAMKAIGLLSAVNISCEINYTISKTNYTQLFDIAETIKNEKFNCLINIGMMKIAGRACKKDNYFFDELEIKDALIKVKQQIKKSPIFKPYQLLQPLYLDIFRNKFGCPAGRLTATINSKGEVYACGLFSEQHSYICGNILVDKMNVIWSGDSMSHIRNLPERYECICCEIYKNKCTGACRGNALNYYGDICEKDINCEVYKIDFQND